MFDGESSLKNGKDSTTFNQPVLNTSQTCQRFCFSNSSAASGYYLVICVGESYANDKHQIFENQWYQINGCIT